MLNIYCVKDTVAGCFLNSLRLNTADALEIREIKEAVRSEKVPYAKDLQLFRLGTFDQDTGVISSDVTHVCNFADFVEV